MPKKIKILFLRDYLMNILRDKICLIERENFVKRFFFGGHKKNS